MIKLKKEFDKLFNEVKENNISIVDLNQQEIDFYKKEFNKQERLDRTNTHLIANIAASLLVMLFPMMAIQSETYRKQIMQYFLSIIHSVNNDTKDFINLTLTLGCSAIYCYFLIFPSIMGKNKKFKNLFITINFKQKNYLFTTIVAIYIAFGFTFFLVYFNWLHDLSVLSTALSYYIIIPLFLIAIFLTMMCLILFMMPFENHINKKKNFFYYRIKICQRLMEILKTINTETNLLLIEETKQKNIISNLGLISYWIKNYPVEELNLTNFEEIRQHFFQSGVEFEKNILEMVFTKNSNLEELKISMISYLNIFLKGDLSKLPKTDVLIVEKSKKVKFIHYFFLAIYLCLPILVMIALKYFFNISLDSFMQSLARILYLIWAIVGILSNPIILNSESKELLNNILNSITGKG